MNKVELFPILSFDLEFCLWYYLKNNLCVCGGVFFNAAKLPVIFLYGFCLLCQVYKIISQLQILKNI